MKVNSNRLWKNLESLAQFTDPENPWTRRSFSPLFLEARKWLASQFEAAGMQVRIDAGGNLIGRLQGSAGDVPPILVGSHSDTVPCGGRFDGMLGVMAALEVAQSLQENGDRLRHDLEVIDFLAEEPSEFGLSCIGSSALAGKIDDAALSRRRNDGVTLYDALQMVGGDPKNIASAYRSPGSIAAYVELHIEQAKILESRQLDIGVVTGIASIRRYRVKVYGQADHAGQTLMRDRADALVGTARIIDLAYRHASSQSTDVAPMVSTVGQIDKISPNATNAVPGFVSFTIECRCPDEDKVINFLDGILEQLRPDFAELAVRVEYELLSHVSPTPCTSSVQSAIMEAADSSGYSHCKLSSGAGHDGMYVAHAGPFGMIFVPCRDGRSHTPDEWLEAEQAAIGADVLYKTIQRLDNRYP